MSEQNQPFKLAVFIDFENVEISATRQFGDFDLSLLLDSIKSRGRITIRRAYGDWSRLAAYRDALREHAVELVQLYSYSYQQGGKNRADIRLAIDAMEVIFTQQHVDAIVIVSGDSDFSSLMSRVREYGKYAIGVGVKASTSDLLVRACDEFIFYDDLLQQSFEEMRSEPPEGRREAGESVAVISPLFGTLPQVLPVSALAATEPPASVVIPERRATDKLIVRRISFTGPLPETAAPTLPPVVSTLPEPAALSGEAGLHSYLSHISLRPLSPTLRRDVIADIVAAAGEGHFLNEIIERLRLRYNFNVMRQQADLREAARLAYRAEIFDFGQERPSLASRIQRVTQPDPVRAARQSDLVYLRKLLAGGLTLVPAEVAALLFSSEEADAVVLLEDLVAEGVAARRGHEFRGVATDLAEKALADDALAVVRDDLRGITLESVGEISRAAAERWFGEASDRAVQDFRGKARAGLQAVKILAELMRCGVPGNGPDELLWWTAVYCCNSAGQKFREHHWSAARRYYLAFFLIMQEGELAWERMRPLFRPMMSYYWATATHEHDIFLHGLTQKTPEEVILELHDQLNSRGQETLREMAFRLAQLNPPLVRSLASQIERSHENTSTDAVVKILRMALERMAQAGR